MVERNAYPLEGTENDISAIRGSGIHFASEEELDQYRRCLKHVPEDILKTIEHKYILELSLVCADETEPVERLRLIRWMHSMLSKVTHWRLKSESIVREVITFLLGNLEEYSDIEDLVTPYTDYVHSFNPPLVDIHIYENLMSTAISARGIRVDYSKDENTSRDDDSRLFLPQPPPVPQLIGTPTTPCRTHARGPTSTPDAPSRAGDSTPVRSRGTLRHMNAPVLSGISRLPPRTNNLSTTGMQRRTAEPTTFIGNRHTYVRGSASAPAATRHEDFAEPDSMHVATPRPEGFPEPASMHVAIRGSGTICGPSSAHAAVRRIGVSSQASVSGAVGQSDVRGGIDTLPHWDAVSEWDAAVPLYRPDWEMVSPPPVERVLIRGVQPGGNGQGQMRLPPRVMLRDDYPDHLFPATFAPHPPIKQEYLMTWEEAEERESRRGNYDELAQIWRPLRRPRLDDYTQLPTREQVDRMLDLRDIFIKIRRSIGHPVGSEMPRFIRLVNGVFPPLGSARYSRPRPPLEKSRNVGGWKLSPRIEPVAAFLYAEKNDCVLICFNELVRKNRCEKIETEFRFLPRIDIPTLEKFFARHGCREIPTPFEFSTPYIYYLDDKMAPIIRYVKNEVRTAFEALFEEGSAEGPSCLHCEKKGTLLCGNAGCSALYCKKCFHCWFPNKDECKACEKPHIAFSKRV
jgi:hypothetical protein